MYRLLVVQTLPLHHPERKNSRSKPIGPCHPQPATSTVPQVVQELATSRVKSFLLRNVIWTSRGIGFVLSVFLENSERHFGVAESICQENGKKVRELGWT